MCSMALAISDGCRIWRCPGNGSTTDYGEVQDPATRLPQRMSTTKNSGTICWPVEGPCAGILTRPPKSALELSSASKPTDPSLRTTNTG